MKERKQKMKAFQDTVAKQQEIFTKVGNYQISMLDPHNQKPNHDDDDDDDDDDILSGLLGMAGGLPGSGIMPGIDGLSDIDFD